ncbi:NAD-dependent epimerase/dehydratase family protein [Streptomyces sp. NPDC091879]|uniref:NAD-dependent epimerase/dehydratase family protein n=1 Tax=Streptomyces sp. NPDC091879 TaxID=3366006 RepID=UPI00381BDB32
MNHPRIVITGATGFIGSAVLDILLDPHSAGRKNAPQIRMLGRTPPKRQSAAVTWTPADLTMPATLDGTCEGADVLLHLACSLSSNESECRAVNVAGTQALMAEATRAGVQRIIHLSTAAVYGPGPHHGPDVNDVRPAPVSPASRTRLAGETPALLAGATVLRPGLVTGPGDRWVVPALAELVNRVPALWDGGNGLQSYIDVRDLARLIARLATAEPPAPTGQVLHASHPEPVCTGDLLASLARHGVLPPVTEYLPWSECLQRLRAVPGNVSERQFALLARDHWYHSDAVWHLADCPPGPGPLARMSGAAAYYRETCPATAMSTAS